MGSADDRRFDVLRAIVADYVTTHEPIGSKALVERHSLGVSSATIRNDMAVLEAEGYITQPHTSSGRVPTEKGYREFVDRLDDVKPLSSAERRAIQGFLESGVDLDDVLRRAVRLHAITNALWFAVIGRCGSMAKGSDANAPVGTMRNVCALPSCANMPGVNS